MYSTSEYPSDVKHGSSTSRRRGVKEEEDEQDEQDKVWRKQPLNRNPSIRWQHSIEEPQAKGPPGWDAARDHQGEDLSGPSRFPGEPELAGRFSRTFFESRTNPSSSRLPRASALNDTSPTSRFYSGKTAYDMTFEDSDDEDIIMDRRSVTPRPRALSSGTS